MTGGGYVICIFMSVYKYFFLCVFRIFANFLNKIFLVKKKKICSVPPQYSIFDFREAGVLGCDTQIVRVDETPCSIMDGLIVCVDVEEIWGENTTLG